MSTIGIFEDEKGDFPASQRAIIPGGPARPAQLSYRRLLYAIVGVVAGLTAGLGNGLVTANAPYLLGAVSATRTEMAWVSTAYVMGFVSMNLLFVRFRQQYGLRRYAMIGLMGFCLLVAAHLFVKGFGDAIFIHAVFGIAASPLTTLSVYYLMAALPPEKSVGGVIIGLGITQISVPLARLFWTESLAADGWRSLYLFELGLGLACLGGITLLRLPPSKLQKVFEPLDFVTFVPFASGMALLCAVLGLGRAEWWTDRDWIGWSLAGAILLLGIALAIESRRKRPLIDLRFLTSSDLIRFTILALVGRVVLAEQNVGAVGLLNYLGVTNDEMWGFSLLLVAASIVGILCAAFFFKPGRIGDLIMLSIGLAAIAAYIDSYSTNQTRPVDFYFTQSLISFSTTMYIGPALLYGVLRVVQAGGTPLAGFLTLFSITQNVGSLMGTAVLGSFQYIRQRIDFYDLVQHLHAYAPQVAARIKAYASSIASVVPDPAQRQAAAVGLLQQDATREASVLSYENMFTLIALLAGLTTIYLAGLILHRRWRERREDGNPPPSNSFGSR